MIFRKRFHQNNQIIRSTIVLFLFLTTWGSSSLAQDNNIRDAKTIYENHCASCHNGGLKGWMTGAPEIKDIDGWKTFFEKDVEKMTHNVYTGEKKHEIKGECEDCSKSEIKATIEYIISVTK